VRSTAPSDGPLLTRRGLLCGAWSALLAGAAFALGLHANLGDPALGGLYNDFADYWAAARILDVGGDPYDRHLVASVLQGAGFHSTIGTGYSYPLLLAELLRPLGLLPPLVAGGLFTAGSLACLALAVALLLSPLRQMPRLDALALASGAGLFAPVVGSLYFGQVNLCLLPGLALAYRGIARPGWLAIAAAVKLYPGAALVAFAAAGRRGLRPFLVTTALTLGLTVGPNLLAGRWSYGDSVVTMFGPDTFWSNQSVNGLLSRLAMPSHWTQPPLPGLPVTPLMVLVCSALGALTVAVASRQRRSWRGAFALLLCFAVVAAPKNSLWNFTPLVIVLVFTWTLVRDRPAELGLLALAWALMGSSEVAGAVRGHSAAGTWLTGLPLYGALLLGVLLSWALLRSTRTEEVGPRLSSAARGIRC
jgi:Glycosyltransferase family 87